MLKLCLPAVAAAALVADRPGLRQPAIAPATCRNWRPGARTALKGINQMVTAAKGKKLDPEAFCARSRPLNTAEEAMLAYMNKNKDWCQIPDDAINQLKATHAKSVGFRRQGLRGRRADRQDEETGGGRGPAGRRRRRPAEQPLPAGPL